MFDKIEAIKGYNGKIFLIFINTESITISVVLTLTEQRHELKSFKNNYFIDSFYLFFKPKDSSD